MEPIVFIFFSTLNTEKIKIEILSNPWGTKTIVVKLQSNDFIMFWLKYCPPVQVNSVSWMESVFVFVFYVFVFWLKYCPQTMVCIINEGHDRGVGSPEGGPASIHRWYHIITPSKYYHIRPSVKISSDWSKYSCERYYLKDNKRFVTTDVCQVRLDREVKADPILWNPYYK